MGIKKLQSPLKRTQLKVTTGVCSSCNKLKPYANKSKKLCLVCNNKLKESVRKEKAKLKRVKKKETITQKKLDQMTSWLVRACYPAVCPHCGLELTKQNSNATHFVTRGKMITRFSLKNIVAADRQCNFYDSSHIWSVGHLLNGVWGQGTSEAQIALKAFQLSLKVHERKEIYDIYKKYLDEVHDGMSQERKYEILKKAQSEYEKVIERIR